MKTEEAIGALECEIDEYSYDICEGFSNKRAQEAILALIDHARSTRWREIKNEKPPVSSQEYEIFLPSEAGCDKFQSDIWWGDGWSEGTKTVSHWREHVGPEEG